MPRSALLVVPLTVPHRKRRRVGAKWVWQKPAQGQQAQGLPVRGASELGATARKALREIKASSDESANGSTVGAEGCYLSISSRSVEARRPLKGEAWRCMLRVPLWTIHSSKEYLSPAPAKCNRSSGEGKAHGGTQSPYPCRGELCKARN